MHTIQSKLVLPLVSLLESLPVLSFLEFGDGICTLPRKKLRESVIKKMLMLLEPTIKSKFQCSEGKQASTLLSEMARCSSLTIATQPWLTPSNEKIESRFALLDI